VQQLATLVGESVCICSYVEVTQNVCLK